jgi:hypothetical protein
MTTKIRKSRKFNQRPPRPYFYHFKRFLILDGGSLDAKAPRRSHSTIEPQQPPTTTTKEKT